MKSFDPYIGRQSLGRSSDIVAADRTASYSGEPVCCAPSLG